MEFIKLKPSAQTPVKSTEGSAGYDLYATEDVAISPYSTHKASTGIALAIPKGVAGLLYARSSLSVNSGVSLANGVGVIDSDYRGEVLVPLYNSNPTPFTVRRGMKIAQIIFTPYLEPVLREVESLEDTVRGDGGFGSTGE